MDMQNPFADLIPNRQAPPPPQPITVGTPDPTRLAAEQRAQAAAERAARAEERAADAAQRAAANIPSGYRPAAGGALAPIPGGPADPAAAAARPGTGQQAHQRSLSAADIEAMTAQFERVAQRYASDFQNNDPMISLGMSEAERGFDRDAAVLRQMAQSAFRTPGVGSQSDYEAQQMNEAYGLDSRNWDTENESVLDGLQQRLNERRRALGLQPIPDWRQRAGAPAIPTPANPNLVQPGESMGQVGTLPIVPGADRGRNELSNEGGMYITAEDRRLAEQATSIANSRMPADQAIAQINALLRQHGREPIPASDEERIRSARRNRSRHPGFSPTPSGRSDPNLFTAPANTSVGAAVISGGDALTFGLLDNMTSDPERTRAGMELIREQHPYASLAGEMAGSLAPGAALERLAATGIRGANALLGGSNVARAPGGLMTIGEGMTRPLGNALYGGAYGAGTADEGDRLAGAGRGALLSVAGGEVGDRAAAGIGRSLTGARDAGTRYLTERGIPLTIGQIAGRGGAAARTLTRVENALESLPWLGDAIRSRRVDSFRGVNTAAFDDALAPIGASTGGQIGEQGADAARTAVSGAYDDALSGVRVTADRKFVGDMRRVIQAGQALPDDLQPHFQHFIDNRLAQAMDRAQLTGTGYQALRQELREARTAVRGQLGARPFVDAVKQLEGALEGLVRRRAPEVVPALQKADQAYRRTRVVEGAVGRAMNNRDEGGMFSPAQLGLEARNNANRYGGDGGTTNRPFFELQRNAQDILPSSVPNSGTADRSWVLAAFPAIAAGGAELTGQVDPKTAALFATIGLPYTRRGQQLFQKLLVERPEVVRRAGEAVLGQRRWAGRAGAGAVNSETDQTPRPLP